MPSPTFPSKPDDIVSSRTFPVSFGRITAQSVVATSSGSSPAGNGGCVTERNFPRMELLNRIDRDEIKGIGFTEALKNGVEEPGWWTDKCVMPSSPVRISKSATCSL